MEDSQIDIQLKQEEAAVRVATIQRVHRPIRKWFRTVPEIVEKFGSYPSFWQDALKWPHFDAVYAAYLTATDAKPASGDTKTVPSMVKEEEGMKDEVKEEPVKEEPVKEEPVKDESVKTESVKTESVKTEPVKTEPKPDAAAARKRRSRFSSKAADAIEVKTSATLALTEKGEEEPKKKRRSRWSNTGKDAKPAKHVELAKLQLLLQSVNQRMTTVAMDALRRERDPDRSPSPPPKYDGRGQRTNTREQRMREALEREQQSLVREMMRLNPALAALGGNKGTTKIQRRVYIPIDDNPDYNFMGRIIGPRGNTHRRLEAETKCKISIRGRGSIKDGRGRRDGKLNGDEDDRMHVLVTGDHEKQVADTVKIIEDLLIPVEDDNDEHKKAQLRELALINGTLKENEFCTVCGERGHRHFECTNRDRTYKMADVRCAICGDASHPTADCPRKNSAEGKQMATFDADYMDFMADVGERAPRQAPTTAPAADTAPPAAAAAPAAVAAPASAGAGAPTGSGGLLGQQPATVAAPAPADKNAGFLTFGAPPSVAAPAAAAMPASGYATYGAAPAAAAMPASGYATYGAAPAGYGAHASYGGQQAAYGAQGGYGGYAQGGYGQYPQQQQQGYGGYGGQQGYQAAYAQQQQQQQGYGYAPPPPQQQGGHAQPPPPPAPAQGQPAPPPPPGQ